METQPTAQSYFLKLNVDNSRQETRKIRYYIFEFLPNFTVYLYFVPNILARISDFCWDRFFNNSIKLLSHYVLIKFFSFLFFSFRLLYLSTRFFCLLTCLSLNFSVAFHLRLHLVSEFLFFVLFRMLWMMVTMNKVKFSLQKTMITFSKFPATGCVVYKIEFTSWKTFTIFIRSVVCPLTSAIIFSEAHGVSYFHAWNL